MNKHDYKQSAYYLMYLIRCVLNNEKPKKEKLDKMNLPDVFEVAMAHSLTAIAAYALESAGIYDKNFEEEKYRAIRKNMIFDLEREKVLSEFEKEGIWYMPLKGVIIKDLYPQIGMRQMGDNDFLIDSKRQNDIKNIMISQGFTVEAFDQSKHDVYYKEPVCNFQMHISLFDKNEKDPRYCYYKEIYGRLISDNSSRYGKTFTSEDFYIYLKAHEYKHYSTGGTGLRSLVDTYVYFTINGHKLDMQYIERECEKLGICDYEKKSCRLALDLLGGKKLTNEDQELFDYIVFSGTYGNFQNEIKNRITNNDSHFISAKLGYFISRLIIPIRKNQPRYNAFANKYPWFYENRARLPLLFVYRILSAVSGRRKNLKGEIKTVLKVR